MAEGSKGEKGWDSAADWYDGLAGDEGSYYQKNVLDPAIYRLLGPVKGLKVLDFGCGQGYLARKLARRGAAFVVGADASEALVAKAREREAKERSGARFVVSDASKGDGLGAGQFHAVVCNMALQNFPDGAAALSTCARVLKPGGRAVFTLNHPCFRVPKASGWADDPAAGVQARRVEAYLSPFKAEISVRPGADPAARTVSYHQPLSALFGFVFGAGLAVTAFEELVSPRRSFPGPRAEAENRARREIPLFAVIALRKPRRG